MKKNSLNCIIFILLIQVLLSSCSNNKGKNSIIQIHEKSIAEIGPGIEYNKLENEVINLTIQTIIDSLSNVIKLNLGKDYPKYKFICLRDTLYDFGDYSSMKRTYGINFDSIKIHKKGPTKLEVLNLELSGGKELKITSQIGYYDIVRLNPVNRCLLVLSKLNFNEKYDECLFSVTCTFSFNSGSDYVVYVKKEKGRWVFKRLIASSVR